MMRERRRELMGYSSLKRKTERNCGIELLRILSAVMVLAYHFVNTCFDMNSVNLPMRFLIYNLFFGGGRLAVNVFVIIGAWFLCDKKIEINKICELWLTTFVYSVLVGFIYFVKDRNSFLKIKQILPISTEVVWFISAYIILMILVPLLNVILAVH